MIELILNPPAALQGRNKYPIRGKTNIDTDVSHKAGSETIDKFVFARKKGELLGILDAIGEVPSSTKIHCVVSNGKWELSGKISFWHEKDRLLLEEAVIDAENAANFIADKCRKVKLSITATFDRQIDPSVDEE